MDLRGETTRWVNADKEHVFFCPLLFPFQVAGPSLRAVFSWAKWSVSLASSVELGPWLCRKGWSWAADRAVFETPGKLSNTQASFHMNLNLLMWICTCRSWGILVTFVDWYSQTHTKNTFCPTLPFFFFFLLALLSPYEFWFLMILFLVIKTSFLYSLPHASFVA